ncbi:MAG: hypothetical protein IBX72_10275 [Nitrospirae bacterium]|nr:hypothetical protein [Nitrospirota bacterium]
MANRQNYTETMELNKQCRLAAGLISECFPEVSDIAIHMIYYQKAANPVLMVRDVNFWPSRHAYFNMECMIKGCINGGFDLTSVITEMIKTHKKSEKGKLICKGKSDTFASDHASIAYHINIKYHGDKN